MPSSRSVPLVRASSITDSNGLAMTSPTSTSARGYTFKCRDFRDTFAAHPGEFLLLDPPYWDVARPLYGTPNAPPFTITDHLELFDLLKDRSNWLLQYDRVEPVLTLYAGFPMVRVQWAYGMGRARDSNEVLILPRESG